MHTSPTLDAYTFFFTRKDHDVGVSMVDKYASHAALMEKAYLTCP